MPDQFTEHSVDDGQSASLRAIVEALHGLRFGSVTVVVQDGVIVQVERIEKRRLARSAKPAPEC